MDAEVIHRVLEELAAKHPNCCRDKEFVEICTCTCHDKREAELARAEALRRDQTAS